jgi:polar amino acid transport system substrate-binding protein
VGTGDPVYPPWMLNNDPAGGEGFENGWSTRWPRDGLRPRGRGLGRPDLRADHRAGAKPFDFAIQQISVTEARAEVVSFSQVYFQPDKAVIALPGSPVEGAASFEDLRAPAGAR